MSQQEARGGGGNLGGSTTGTICTKSGLYKTTDGKIEFIEYIHLYMLDFHNMEPR